MYLSYPLVVATYNELFIVLVNPFVVIVVHKDR